MKRIRIVIPTPKADLSSLPPMPPRQERGGNSGPAESFTIQDSVAHPPRTNPPATPLNLGLGFLKRRGLLMLLVFAAVFTPLAMYVSKRPHTYAAEVKVLLKSTQVLGQSPLDNDQTKVTPPTEPILQAEIELMRNGDVLAAAAMRSGLLEAGADAAELESEIQRLRRSVKISPIGLTNLISIRYADESAERAARFANALADAYIEKHVEVRRAPGVSDLLEKEVQRYESDLGQAQRALAGLRSSGDFGTGPEQITTLVRRRAELEAADGDADSAIREAEQRTAELRRARQLLPQRVELSSRSANNPALIERWKTRLAELETRRADLLSKYDPSYRLVREVEAQIAATEAVLRRDQRPEAVESTSAPNPLRQTIEADLLQIQATMSGLSARRQRIREELTRIRARLQRTEMASVEAAALERTARFAEENLNLYRRKLEESRLAHTLDQRKILNVTVLERAVPPLAPEAQHASLFLAFAFIGAFAFSVFVSGMIDFLATSRESALMSRIISEPAVRFPLTMSRPVQQGTDGSARARNESTSPERRATFQER
jgi:uncharacterized protein involved in exopolysaccharide biosynthesis